MLLIHIEPNGRKVFDMLFFAAQLLAKLGFAIPIRICNVPNNWHAVYEDGEYRRREASDNGRAGVLYRHPHGVMVVDTGDSFLHSPRSVVLAEQ